jgi:hypothetical protein
MSVAILLTELEAVGIRVVQSGDALLVHADPGVHIAPYRAHPAAQAGPSYCA